MIVDTHSHLNFKAYDADRDEVIKRTQDEGVVCIDVGTKYETSKRAVELAEQNENIYAAIGLHPIYIDEKFDAERYRELAESKKVVAIGEIGLDKKYPNANQKEIFIKQLDLAEELNLPVIIHCRMAFADLYEILSTRKLKGVIHCFTGSLEEAQKYVELGYCLGINGIIYKMDLNEVVKQCPLDRILTETDCPYLTPKEEGDKRNEPIFVKHIIQKIADIKGTSFDEVAKVIADNAGKLFRIQSIP